MIEVIPFKCEHAYSLKDYMSLLQVHSVEAYGRLLEADATAFTGVCDGRVIGAAGVHPIHEGVGQAWALLSPEVRRAKFFLHREVKRRMRELLELGLFHRLEIIVHSNFAEAIIWADRLGFIFEGISPMYGPDGSDYHRFGLTKKQLK
jgi:RimJ/RimL family protein N-acetyltransferase